jgi:aryl-alcohol dehydrogenase-like predicted oxidoreductase
MDKRILGRTGYSVSPLGFGSYQCTGQFGVSIKEADRVLDYVCDSEINYLDTAMLYGFGESEALIGQALRRHPQKKAIVCDKVGHFQVTISRASGNIAFTSVEEIKRNLKNSLWILQKDALDIVMIHECDMAVWDIDYSNGNSVVVSVLEELKKEGLIAHIGISSWDCNKLAQLIETDRFDVVLNAGGITLLERPIFEKVIPAAKKHNLGVTVGGGFGQNNPMLVAKTLERIGELLDDPDERVVVMGKKLKELYKIADDQNTTMIELAIRYILTCEDIHCHVPGARIVSHVKGNLDSAKKGPLDKSIFKEINKIQDMGSSLSALELAIQVESDIKVKLN